MSEHAVRFGPWRSLVGVVCEPANGSAVPGAPDVLLLNAGLLHHVGPNRLYVNLARRLADKGVRSLRFDLSGIGDSGPRQDRTGREESVVAETVDAMDHLAASHGAERFVLYGICTGADQAVRVALRDPRVVGVVLVDGYAYRTRGYYLHYYAHRLLRIRSWLNVLTGKLPAVARRVSRLRGKTSRPATPTLAAGLYMPPSREEAEARMIHLLDRGCALCFVFTPGAAYNHASQLGEMFPAVARHPQVRSEFLAHSNHEFTLRHNQQAMMDVVDCWMEETVLAGHGATREPV